MNEVNAIKSKREINAMKKALSGRDKLLFIIGINSGLRISDILKLKVGDVRGKDGITLKETKTAKSKRFVFNRSIKEVVRDNILKEADANEYLFRSRKGDNKPISRVQAYRILNDAAERAGIDGAIGTHTLRKTFGYHSYQNGTDIALLMRIFNHSSQAITLRYIGITQEQIDEVYTRINL